MTARTLHRGAPSPYARDQARTSFTTILDHFIRRIPGAHGVALVDLEGETVDYAGHADPFDIKLSAAHWRLVLGVIADHDALGEPRSLVVRGTRRSFVAYALPEGYALVLLLGRRAGFAASSRAFYDCERALAREAGWSVATGGRQWHAVRVDCDRRKRPIRVRTGRMARSLEVLGVVVPASPGRRVREQGFRVRLDSGAELTLVREAGGHWYSDEPLEQPSAAEGDRVRSAGSEGEGVNPRRERGKSRAAKK
jgi:hypothetical protein